MATSSEAIIGYSGDVVPCIISASLNRSCSTGARGPGRTCTMAPCDSAASSLWVDWVAKTVGRSGPGKVSSSTDMPYRPAYSGWKRAYANHASSKCSRGVPAAKARAAATAS